MDEMFEHDDCVTDFLAALPALDAGEQPVGPARYRRIELDFGDETAWFEDPFSGEAFGVPCGKGPRTVYLLLDGAGRVPEVRAVLVRFGDALPVETDWAGDGVMTGSGFLLLHGGEFDYDFTAMLQVAARARAALQQWPPVDEDDWDRVADLDRSLREKGIDVDSLTAEGERGDYAEGWLLAPGSPAEPTVLGCFVDPDGYQLVPCLDAEGNEAGALLHC
jgi:hypothetical protein